MNKEYPDFNQLADTAKRLILISFCVIAIFQRH